MWIHNLYKSPKKKWLFAFLISDVPMLLVLTPYLVTYWNLLWAYPIPRLVSILLAGFWTWLGPYLILRWHTLFEKFLSEIDSITGSDKTVWNVYQTKIRHSAYTRIISVTWTLAVVSILLLPSGRQNLATYYLYGFCDINYWIFIICVAYIAQFTSSFILFMIYSYFIINAVMDKEAVVSHLLQNAGKHTSMPLIGDLIARTAVYFSSGFFFFPVMTVFYLETQDVTFNTSAAVFILMGMFVALIGVYLGIMNWIVCERAQASKDRILETLETKLRQTEIRSMHCKDINKKILYTLSKQDLRQQISEASKICISPLETNQYLKIAYGVLLSAVLPAVTSFLLDMMSL